MGTKLNYRKALESPLLQWTALGGLLAITAYLFIYDASRGNLVDFQVYLEAAKRLAAHESPYGEAFQVLARDGRTFSLYYLYPPFLAVALMPGISASPDLLNLLWCLLNYAALLGCAGVMTFLTGHFGSLVTHWRARFIVCLFFLSCFEPVYHGIMDGQVHLLVLLTLLLILRTSINGSPLSGFWLSLGVALKMSPVLLGLKLLLTRDWKAVGMAIVSAAGLLLACALGGFWWLIDSFLMSTTQVLAGGRFQNFTFNFSLDRAMGAVLNLEPTSSAHVVLRGVLLALCLGVCTAVWGLSLRGKISQASELSHARLIGFLCVSLILASPLVWVHHLTWALVPLLVLLIHVPQSGPERLRHFTIILGLYFALSQVSQLHVLSLTELPALLPVTALFPSVCLVVIGAILLRLELSAQKRER